MALHTLGRLVISIADILQMVLKLYTFVIIGSVIISWVKADPYNPIVRFIRQLTEPVFSRVRRVLPTFFFRSGIDFTPMIVLMILLLLENVLLGFLFELGQNLLRK